MFSFISTGAPVQNGSTYDLVDEKGGHEDIHEFASKSDIVVCCLSLNSETVSCSCA
jgi:phosphoglycerate dehydrogenase-like enzyme